jgi:hypothetical protein
MIPNTGACELGKQRGRKEKPVGHNIDLAVSERERLGKASGTRERLRKVGQEGMELVPALPDVDKRGNSLPAGQVQRVLAAPLDRLWKTGFVTQREYNAGDAYRADAYMAAIDPSALTIDWNRTGGEANSANAKPPIIMRECVMAARSAIDDCQRIADEIAASLG